MGSRAVSYETVIPQLNSLARSVLLNVPINNLRKTTNSEVLPSPVSDDNI